MGFILVLIVIGGVLPSLNILVTIELIDWISNVVQGAKPFELADITKIIVLWGLITLASEVTAGVLATLQVVVVEHFSAALLTKLSNKLMTLEDLSFFESRDNLVKIGMVKEGLTSRPLNYVYNTSLNLQKIVSLISLFAVLLTIHVWLPILMFFATVPVMLIANYAGKRQWRDIDALQDDKEKMYTYLKHGLDGEKAKDNFLFGFVKHFQSQYQQIRNRYIDEFSTLSNKALLFSMLISFISALITVSLFVLMVFIVVKKHFGVGAVAGYVQAFVRVQTDMQDLATFGKWFHVFNGYFGNYFSLIDWNKGEQKADTTKPLVLAEKIHTIELKNVSFAYPHQDNAKTVINNVNLVIDTQKTYAIVGKNGSGKTTLIKLLAGFYTPQSGEIIINGRHNLKDIDIDSYRGKLSAVFQDFAIYGGYTIDDNIFVNSEYSSERMREKIELVTHFDTEFQERLKHAYANTIGLQYGGEDLSGGQRQRLAALRAFLKPSDVIFFDEPTSAIDPIAEREFIDLIFKMSQDKIALVVTHRMGSVKNAHEIIVIDKGNVVEQGTFDMLVDKKGLFFELYHSQKATFET